MPLTRSLLEVNWTLRRLYLRVNSQSAEYTVPHFYTDSASGLCSRKLAPPGGSTVAGKRAASRWLQRPWTAVVAQALGGSELV